MTRVRLESYQGLPPFGDWRNAVLLPWQAVVTGVEGGPGFGASVGPLMLALGAWFWIGWGQKSRRQRTLLCVAALLGGAGLIVWAAAGRLSELLIQTRLYLALAPGFAVLAGAGFAGLTTIRWPGVRLTRVLGVVVALVFGLNILQVSIDIVQKGAPQRLLHLHSGGQYLADNLGMYALAVRAVDDLPEEPRVLLLWEPRRLYCAPRCYPDEVLDRWLLDRRSLRTPDAILESWRRAGYSHLLVYHTGAQFFREDPRLTAADWQAHDALLDWLSPVVDLDGVYTLYRLPDR